MKRGLPIALFLLSIGVVSCARRPAPQAQPPASPPVTFAVAKAESVPLTISTFGNAVTIADVTLQAQVQGILTRYAVEEGALVKKGDLIAEIDPAPYQAALEEAKGSLDSAKAQLANAQVTLQRQQELYKTKTIDLADLQTAEASQLQAQGAVLSAEGELSDAGINLGYCTISSPIDGKTGRYLVDAGNLVAANTTKLINVQTIDPIYVEFTISENDFDRVRRYLATGGLDVEVSIPGAPEKKAAGKLTFVDNAISSDTGTLPLRATIPNSDTLLWPGLFVNVELVLTTLKGAIVIPAQCIVTGQKGPYVFVIGPDDAVTLRPVQPGQRHTDFTVIADGVKAGDRVVVAGQLGLNDGMKVTPVPYQPPPPLPGRESSSQASSEERK